MRPVPCFICSRQEVPGAAIITSALSATALRTVGKSIELNRISHEIIVDEVWCAVKPTSVFSKKATINELKKRIAVALSSMYVEASPTEVDYKQFRIATSSNVPKINVFLLCDEGDDGTQEWTSNVIDNAIPAAFISAVSQFFVRKGVKTSKVPIMSRDLFDMHATEIERDEVRQESLEATNANSV